MICIYERQPCRNNEERKMNISQMTIEEIKKLSVSEKVLIVEEI